MIMEFLCRPHKRASISKKQVPRFIFDIQKALDAMYQYVALSFQNYPYQARQRKQQRRQQQQQCATKTTITNTTSSQALKLRKYKTTTHRPTDRDRCGV